MVASKRAREAERTAGGGGGRADIKGASCEWRVRERGGRGSEGGKGRERETGGPRIIAVMAIRFFRDSPARLSLGGASPREREHITSGRPAEAIDEFSRRSSIKGMPAS